MTELVIQSDEITVFSESEEVKLEIEATLQNIASQQVSLASSYVRLAKLVIAAQRNRYWYKWGFASAGEFISFIGNSVSRAKSQIYGYVSVVENLLPYVSEEALDKMGISRALELSRFVKSGKTVTQKLIEAATDSAIKLEDLHVMVLTEMNEKGEVLGKWYEPLSGFYATAEERKEIQSAIDAVKRELPEVLTLPDHMQRKEIMLALSREFVSTYPGSK